jgi:hypothetical protein
MVKMTWHDQLAELKRLQAADARRRKARAAQARRRRARMTDVQRERERAATRERVRALRARVAGQSGTVAPMSDADVEFWEDIADARGIPIEEMLAIVVASNELTV